MHHSSFILSIQILSLPPFQTDNAHCSYQTSKMWILLHVESAIVRLLRVGPCVEARLILNYA